MVLISTPKININIPGLSTRGTGAFISTPTLASAGGIKALFGDVSKDFGDITRSFTKPSKISTKLLTTRDLGGISRPQDIFRTPRTRDLVDTTRFPTDFFTPTRPTQRQARLGISPTRPTERDIRLNVGLGFEDIFEKPRKRKDKIKEKKTKGKKRKTPIRPSLTGVFLKQFKIKTGSLPKELGIGGISPGSLRFAPADIRIGLRKRKRRKKR